MSSSQEIINYDKIISHFQDSVLNLHQDQLHTMLERLVSALSSKFQNSSIPSNHVSNILHLMSLTPAIVDNVAKNNMILKSQSTDATVPVNPTEFSPFHLIPLWCSAIDSFFVSKMDSYMAIESLSADTVSWLTSFRDNLLPILALEMNKFGDDPFTSIAREHLAILAANVLESLLVFLDRASTESNTRSLKRRLESQKKVSDFYRDYFSPESCKLWLKGISDYFSQTVEMVVQLDTAWPRKSSFLFDLFGAIFQHKILHDKFVTAETIKLLISWGNTLASKTNIYSRLTNVFWTAVDKSLEAPAQELVVLSALSQQTILQALKDRMSTSRAILDSRTLGSESRIHIVLDALSVFTLISVKNPSIIPKFVELGITQDITEHCLAKLDTFRSSSSSQQEDLEMFIKKSSEHKGGDEANLPSKWTNQTDYRLAYLLLGLLCEFSQNHVQDPTLDRGKITDGLLIFLHNDSDPFNPRCKELIQRTLIVLESNLEVFSSIHIFRLTDFVSNLLSLLIGINGNIAEAVDQNLRYSKQSNSALYKSSTASFTTIGMYDIPRKDRLSNLPFFSRQSFEHFANDLLSYLDHALVLICSLASSGGFDKNAIEGQADGAIFTISLSCLSNSKLLTASCLVKALFTVASICSADPSKRDILARAIPIILKFTRYNASDKDEEERVIVSAVEAIWQGVVGHPGNEIIFFENDGISMLLDCLRRTSFYIKRHVIGCLLDLLSNEKAAEYVWEWRYPEDVDKNILNLLSELWETEEARKKHQRLTQTASNILEQSDISRITRSRIFPNEGEKVLDVMLDTLGFKIYAFVCKLGLPKLSEKCKGNPSHLLALTQIVKFYDLKMSQAWLECEEELKIEGIRPVSPDQSCVDQAKEFMWRQAEEMIGVTQYLENLEIEMTRNSEINHYNKIVNRAK